jgi:hypothetical protein
VFEGCLHESGVVKARREGNNEWVSVALQMEEVTLTDQKGAAFAKH